MSTPTGYSVAQAETPNFIDPATDQYCSVQISIQRTTNIGWFCRCRSANPRRRPHEETTDWGVDRIQSGRHWWSCESVLASTSYIVKDKGTELCRPILVLTRSLWMHIDGICRLLSTRNSRTTGPSYYWQACSCYCMLIRRCLLFAYFINLCIWCCTTIQRWMKMLRDLYLVQRALLWVTIIWLMFHHYCLVTCGPCNKKTLFRPRLKCSL